MRPKILLHASIPSLLSRKQMNVELNVLRHSGLALDFPILEMDQTLVNLVLAISV